MKIYNNYLARLPRVVRTGAVVGATIFATSALQAQPPPPTANPNPTPPIQNPASQNPAGQSSAAQYPLSQDPGTQNRTAPATATSVNESSTESPAKLSHRAKEYLTASAQANLTETAMANVAAGKSQNTQVKDFAQMLRTDLQTSYGQLQSLAQAHDITLSTSPDWLNQREINHLQKSSDAEFDREYMKAALKEQVKCVKRDEKAMAEIQDPAVNQFAANALPKVRSHLQRSQEVARSAGLDESTIASILKGLPSEDQNVAVK